MKVLNTTDVDVPQKTNVMNKNFSQIEELHFETLWNNSISSEEFVKQSYQHIEKLYENKR